MSEEEQANGISVEELKEKESLIEELVEREDTIQAKAESASKQQLKDNETAEDIRKKAMESLKETKKRNSDEGGASPKRRKSKYPAVHVHLNLCLALSHSSVQVPPWAHGLWLEHWLVHGWSGYTLYRGLGRP